MARIRSVHGSETGSGKPAVPPDHAGDPQRIALNREDALALLAGLGWPDRPPGKFIALPLADGKLVRLEAGVRRSEIDELAAGLAARFSILVELRRSETDLPNDYVRWNDIAKLVFGSEADRDAFVFRPFAEFDPSSIKVAVDSALFGLDGPSRFAAAKAAGDDPAAMFADRIGGGVAVLSHLVARRPALIDAAAAILGARPRHGAYDNALDSLIRRFGGFEQSPMPDDLGSIADGFVAAHGTTGRELVQNLFDRLIGGEPNVDPASVETRWYERAMDLFDNRIELSGKEFGDERRIDLRAALLAAHAGRLDALETALDLPTPAGPTVVALASFLMGLSIGLRGLDWPVKCNAAGALSEVAAGCYRSLRSGAVPPGKFELHLGKRVALAFNGQELAAGPASVAERAAPTVLPPTPGETPPELPGALAQAPTVPTVAAALKSLLVDDAANADGWRPVILPDGKEAELRNTIAEGRTVFAHLRRRLAPTTAAAKAAGLLAANLEPGAGWRLGKAGKDCYAVVDFPVGFAAAELDTLWRTLIDLERRFVKQRPAKRIRSKAKAKIPEPPG